jgi:predicted nucleotidyltransferase
MAEMVDVDGRVVHSARLASLCDRFGFAELAVFGSVARGDASPDSDIDLLYELTPGARLGFDLFDLEDGLAELFGRPVDLVSKAGIHRLIRQRVLADARILYAA